MRWGKYGTHKTQSLCRKLTIVYQLCVHLYIFREIISENEKIREFLQILKFSETLPLSAVQNPNYRESAGKNIKTYQVEGRSRPGPASWDSHRPLHSTKVLKIILLKISRVHCYQDVDSLLPRISFRHC